MTSGASPDASHDPVVVFVIASLSVGGAEGQLVSLLERIPTKHASTRVRILTLTDAKAPPLLRRCEAIGLPIDTLDRTRMSFAAFLLALLRYFRTTRPDLVHTFLDGTPGTWGRLAARLARVPVVLHSSRSLNPASSRLQRRMASLLNAGTQGFLTNAEAIAQRLQRQGVPPERIHVIPNGVDLERFAAGGGPDLRDSLDLPSGAVVAGYLGGLRPVKRPDLLLDAVLELPEPSRPDAVLIAGDGPLRAPIEDRIASDPWLSRHCRLLGRCDDPPSFLRTIDFLVLPSDTEGLPNAVIEALAAERPCVATRVSDVPALVGDGGFVVEPGDATALADAIGRMASLPRQERQRLGAAAGARIRRDFDLGAVAERFWALHHEFLAARARTGATP